MIGVLGGTFDPIHYGHLRTALDVMESAGLEEVRFIPLYQAVHREQPEVTGEVRLRMIQEAISDQPGFVADDRELQRQGDSYTVDTLGSLRSELGVTPICLIVGCDAFSKFLSWHRPQEILDLAHLIVMKRPGHEDLEGLGLLQLVEEREVESAQALNQRPAGRILFQTVTQLEISSTQIRKLVAAGISTRYLIPDGVREIIEAEGLYRD
jgi:nicotinate-nucleotide adenylyltransferase